MAEYLKNKGCPQKDSAEHEGYAGARRSFRRIWKERNSAQPELLEKILDRNTVAVKMAMTKERLIRSGFYDLAKAYQSVHVNY